MGVLVIDLSEDHSEPQVFINPEVKVLEPELSEYDEGCLSIPGLYVEMLRPKTVLMRGIDIDGEIVELEAEGYLPVRMQVETRNAQRVLMDREKNFSTIASFYFFPELWFNPLL